MYITCYLALMIGLRTTILCETTTIKLSYCSETSDCSITIEVITLRYGVILLRNTILFHMENGYLTSGDLALFGGRGFGGYGCGYGYGDCGYGYRHGNGTATTGVGLAAGLGGGALLLAAAGLWGLNQASKSRARGAENQANANAKTVELLANVVNREAVRQDGINIDVNQTQRSLSAAFGTGGSAASNALATAEALSLLNNGGYGNNGLNSAVGGCNYLRVARVSGSRLCGCGCSDSEG